MHVVFLNLNPADVPMLHINFQIYQTCDSENNLKNMFLGGFLVVHISCIRVATLVTNMNLSQLISVENDQQSREGTESVFRKSKRINRRNNTIKNGRQPMAP